jgi:hypothetical protein
MWRANNTQCHVHYSQTSLILTHQLVLTPPCSYIMGKTLHMQVLHIRIYIALEWGLAYELWGNPCVQRYTVDWSLTG